MCRRFLRAAIEVDREASGLCRPALHERLDELRANLQEVVEMLLEEGDPRLESMFVGTQTVEVA